MRRPDRGLVGLAALWILVVLVVLAQAALMISRHRSRQARAQLEEFSVIKRTFDLTLLARNKNFESAPEGVTVEKMNSDTGLIRVVCAVPSGGANKTVETEWGRSAGEWRAVTWRELN